MKFSVDQDIFSKFPGLHLGVVVALGVNNKNGLEILAFLREQEEKTRKKFSGVTITKHPHINSWREVYRAFGTNPRKCLPSVEALVRRVKKGNSLPDINPLVNLYNALSLKYLLPFGGEDLDKVKGDIRLTFAKGIEKGRYIGSEKISSCDRGEIAYLDAAGFICRRFNWREADRTKLTKETKNAVLVAEAIPPVGKETLQKAVNELAGVVERHLAGKVKIYILSEDNNSFSLDFKTGKKLSLKEVGPTLGGTPTKKKKSSVFEKLRLTANKYLYLAKDLEETLKRLMGTFGVSLEYIHLEHPANEDHGDYSTNVAMVLFANLKAQSSTLNQNKYGTGLPRTDLRSGTGAKSKTATQRLKLNECKNPGELAAVLVEELNADRELQNIVDKVEVAGPGFINFWLKKEWLVKELNRVLEKDNTYGHSYIIKGKKIAVEYTDPNPFKEFHLGHLYSNVIGESIARMLEACGARVWRGNFYGDVGMHIAKAVWGMIKKMEHEKTNIQELERLSITQRQHFLGQGYALGVKKYEEEKLIQEEIKELNFLIYIAAQEILRKNKDWRPIINYRQYIKGKEEKLVKIQQVYEAGLRWSLEYFETIYKKLGTKFDGYYPESWVGEYGMKLVEKGLKMGVLEISDGVVIYRGKKDGLHTRVFVNKLGLPTYEAKDLGLAKAKYQDFKYDLSINVFGKEIDEYYQVVKAAMIKIVPQLGKRAYHIAHGMVKLPEGKMSSRRGNVITYEWLMKEMKKYVLKIMKDTDLVEEEKQNVAKIVGMGAVRYALLKNSIGNDVIFDFEKSVSFDGDSGPYLQYTYARCKSVLHKAGLDAALVKSQALHNKIVSKLNLEELVILRWIYRFPEVVQKAALQYAPNLICSFLFELAQRYNTFYHQHSILKAERKEQKEFRLLLTVAVAQVLRNGLLLLGIKAPERM